MTAAVAAEGEFHLEAQDVRTQDTSDSDSDSGQGSCEMSFRSQISKEVASIDEGDSDEEICTRKRVKCRRVLADSNSEGEDGVPEQLKAAPSDVDSPKERYNWLAVKENRDKAGLNGDDSDAENLWPRHPEKEEGSLNRKDRKEKSSSRKRKRKEEKKRKTTRQARRKEKPQEQKEHAEDFPFNDSGCLLTDKELFDNGLEEEEEDEFSFQVEDLETSINAAEKVKTKKQKLFLESEDYKHVMDKNEEPLLKESRKRKLKPIKLTKEESKQLHSESQRLVREAAMTLPYHLPEAKSVQEFFKHKPRPSFQGSAMTLLKSMNTQPNLFKEESVTGNPRVSCHNNGKEQSLQPGTLDLPISGFANPLAAGNSPAEEMEHLTRECSEEDKQNDDFQTEFRDDLNSEEEGELNEVHAESTKPLEEKLEGDIVEERESQSLELPALPQEPIQGLEPVVEIPGDKIKKARLDRLRKLGVDLSIKPKLCSGMESFIDLDEPEPNRELEALKERFVKHAFHTAQPKTERTVSLNIIRKEMTNDGKEELKADVVPVTLATEMVEDAARTKPGEKLQALKAKLQAAMKLRRTEERQKRYALFKLDNEEVMEEDEEEEEEEEEEMSDEEEEEEEEEEEANQEDPDDLGEMEEEHEELGDPHLEADKETDKESADEDEAARVGLPCSVVSKPSSTESTLLLFKDNSSKIGCFLAGEKVELEEALSKRAEKQDDEDSFLLPTLAKENSHNSSFELIGSMIPSYQPCNKQMGRGGNFFSAIGTARSPSPGFFKTSFISSASKSSGKTSEPSLPIEDSQDLYNVTPEEKSPVPTGGRFQFSLEDDTQSQLLDADGFLNVGHHRNKYQSCKSRLPLASMDENAMDANMGELFDLYSGQNQHSPNPGSGKKSDMEELLNLCSGKFPSQDSPLQASSATAKLKKKRRMEDPGAEPLALFSSSFPAEREVEDEEKEEEFGEFQLLTDDHPFDSEEEDEKSEEEEEEEESDQEEEGGDELEFDDEEELKQREGRKNKFHLQDFMEDEAELSGSEGGSEDEYDGEDLNEYEEDVLDEVLPADGELHDQVNKIHMKMMLDDDKRQLRLYQERYLLDGDLHNDGPGRTRKFRWKNLDDVPEGDAFHRDADSGDENENHLEETEAKWRKERFEREQWFREQSTKGEEEEEVVEVDEDSQFMRLAKKVTNKLLQKKASSAVTVQGIKSLPRNPFESFQPGSKPQLKNGSLLNQPRAVLQKLAAMSDLNPNAPRNSRNFVFQTLSPVKSEDVREKAKPQVKRRTAVALPSPKRLRLDSTSVQETRSIFQYLER